MENFDLQLIQERPYSATIDRGVAVLYATPALNSVPTFGMTMKGTLVGVVESGEMEFIVDGHTYSLQPGDVYTVYPGSIIYLSNITEDAMGYGVFLTPEMSHELFDKMNVDWTLRMMALSREVIHTKPEETARLILLVEALKSKMEEPAYTYRKRAVESIMLAFTYDLFDIRDHARNVQQKRKIYTAAENLFQQFIQTLTDPQQPFYNVNTYAKQLNITSKYFSAICKQLTGKTASNIIAEEIIRTAKHLLQDTSKGIKEISDELNFANQSHFGCFFRRHTGKSPLQYRNEL